MTDSSGTTLMDLITSDPSASSAPAPSGNPKALGRPVAAPTAADRKLKKGTLMQIQSETISAAKAVRANIMPPKQKKKPVSYAQLARSIHELAATSDQKNSQKQLVNHVFPKLAVYNTVDPSLAPSLLMLDQQCEDRSVLRYVYYYLARILSDPGSQGLGAGGGIPTPNWDALAEVDAVGGVTRADVVPRTANQLISEAKNEDIEFHARRLQALKALTYASSSNSEILIKLYEIVFGILDKVADALKIHNPKSVLLGFVGGTDGLFAQKTLQVTDDILSTYKIKIKNQGGYDLLGRTRDQIRTTEQVNAALAACYALKLDGLVIIRGVTSNTDVAQLAEIFAEAKCPTKVVGVPVTLNGDLKNQFVETDVGFDTICKVNSQLISNVCTDALSAEKYYYFIRLMGRKASHVALECTLQSHPNMVILGEEVVTSKLTLFDITKQICDAVQARADQDKYHGVVLLPEGLIESIPEVYALLQEIHGLHSQGVSMDNISSQLSPWASALFEFLPPFIKKQLLLRPESDDSAQLSQIETEKLLAHLVESEMNKRTKAGTYKGKKFNAICHFFGYQARGSLPSKFDCDYAYVLGHICYHILAAGLNGYMATVTNLKSPVNKWKCGAAPFTAMMTVKRHSRGFGNLSIGKAAIHPATVDLKGKAYELLRQSAARFLMDDIYRNPGPLQFDGPGADAKAVSLCVEDQDYMGRIKQLQEYLAKVRTIVKPGCSQDILKAALSAMASVTDILSVMSTPSNGQQTYL